MEEHRKNVKGRESIMRIGRSADGETRIEFLKAIRPDDERCFWRGVTSAYVIEKMKDAFSAEIEAYQKAERG
ncbi:hypothetical protein IHQ71_07975 [Rhizobium sp. TH2]|uniref:hypothetical protein n=1 Tax=Rhizobium sp. TH2 TaxID=2775403 RepID=UPI002157EDB9|nr:hypothetical protein [Rhizobium sp. TH2]UVC10519.1 hypothetical protein IHQ71_07975 [Rhizobium sp. TH2]